MRKIVVALLVLGMALFAAPIALATPANCETATRTVVDLEAKLKVLTDSQEIKNIPAMEKQLKALRGELVALQSTLDGLLKVVPPDLAAIAKLKGDVAAKLSQVTSLDKLIIDLKAKVADLEAQLKVAVGQKEKLCAPPTTTPPPTVTTTVTPPPPGVEVSCATLSYDEAQAVLKNAPSDPFNLDPDKDGEACDFKRPASNPVTPSGSVNTGGGPVL